MQFFQRDFCLWNPEDWDVSVLHRGEISTCCVSEVSLLLKCFSHNSILKIKSSKDLETQRLCWGIWCPLCRSLFPEPQRLDLVTYSYRDKTFKWSPLVSCFQLYSLKLYWHKENCQERSSDENQHLEEKYRQKTFWILWHFLLKESYLTLYEF